MMTRKTLVMAAALLTLTTGACSRSNDEPMPPENYSDMAESPANEPAVTQAPLPEPTPVATADANMAAELPPEAAPAPDEQMMDDASATGMTSRASRNEATPDDTGPVEQIEKK